MGTQEGAASVRNTKPTDEIEAGTGLAAARAEILAELERDGIPAAPIHVVMALIDRLAAGPGDES